MRKGKRQLREGFTTGSAAAAAAKAALLYLRLGKPLKEVEIPLPAGGRLVIPVERVAPIEGGSRATVIKDAGDDPDVTHRAGITVTVRIDPGGDRTRIAIEGGRGVGRVTRPGLPVAVGEPAINPAPRKQIRDAVREALEETGSKGAVSVLVEVADGERIARKTLNPRLGIIGGISILGTRGTVKPFSNEAYRDTITLSMDVARAQRLTALALTTGGKSEKFLKREIPDLPDVSFIQVADFFAFSMKEAVKREFRHIHYACFFGKLIKMAQGHPYTHARDSAIDFDLVARWAREQGMDPGEAEKIKGANTGREVRERIKGDRRGVRILRSITEKALQSARMFAGPVPDLSFYLFDFDGERLVREEDRGGR